MLKLQCQNIIIANFEIMYLFLDNSKTLELEIANNGTKGILCSPYYYQEKMVKM